MSTETTLPRVAVVGSGLMGHGIAEVFARAGADVILIGRREEGVAVAVSQIETSQREFAARGLIASSEVPETLARIRTSIELEAAVDADLVIEAVIEDVDLKKSIFARLDAVCASEAVLASSSGHPMSELTAEVSRPSRAIAMHFWNPPQLVPLVELCPSPDTSKDVVEWCAAVLERIGKLPAILDREIAGFIGNRLQFALLREAMFLQAAGVASAGAIDTAVKASFGRRLSTTGPLESMDLGGLDVMISFADFVFPELDSAHEVPQEIRRAAEEARASGSAGVAIPSAEARERLAAQRRDALFRQLQWEGAEPGPTLAPAPTTSDS